MAELETDYRPQWEFERPSFELGSIPDEWLRKIRDYAQSERSIEAIYLFGSRATGCYRDNSDLDLAVLLDTKPEEGTKLWNQDRVQNELRDLLAPISVDVRAMFRDADFMSCVRRHGIRLYLKQRA